MRLAPNAWKLPITLLLKPVTIATIAITVATPTTIPRIVKLDRSLCSRMALKPNRTFSAKPRRRLEKKLTALSSQLSARSPHSARLAES